MSAVGVLQENPPSTERLTITALDAPGPNVGPLIEIAIWCAVPSGEIVIQGSDARAKSIPLAALPPVQRVKAAAVRVHVRPASSDTPVSKPRAPPSDQRSCCHTPMRWLGL